MRCFHARIPARKATPVQRATGPRRSGPGLIKDLPKILDIRWDHDGPLDFGEFQKSNQYDAHPKESLTAQVPPLTIYFNRQAPGHRPPDFPRQYRLSADESRENFTGQYYASSLMAFSSTSARGPHTTPASRQVRLGFVPYKSFSTSHTAFWDGFNDTIRRLRPKDLHSTSRCSVSALEGDFIYMGKTFKENLVLDAENIGACVGSSTTSAIRRGSPAARILRESGAGRRTSKAGSS